MMFPRIGKSEIDTECNDGEHVELEDSYYDLFGGSDLTSPFFNGSSTLQANGPIFVQPDPNFPGPEAINNSHEHLMILAAAAAVNSSSSDDSYKPNINSNDSGFFNSSESPHFSIHDPPLIRLSPTSPNTLFRHGRLNDEYQGFANSVHDTAFSPTNVDWLGQELYVKTDSSSADLTHSQLKRHSFNNSLSSNELPALRRRRRRIPSGARDINYPNNNTSHIVRSRKELKRKRTVNLDDEYNLTLNSLLNSNSVAVDDFSLAAPIDENGSGNHSTPFRNSRLTPELSARRYHWWHIKKSCDGGNNLFGDKSDPIDQIHPNTPEFISTSSGDISPVTNRQQSDQESSAASINSSDVLNQSSNQTNFVSIQNEPIKTPSQTPISSENQNSILQPSFTLLEHCPEVRYPRSNVSSYLRQVLMPQLRNRNRVQLSNEYITVHRRDLQQIPRINAIPTPQAQFNADQFSSVNERSSTGLYRTDNTRQPNNNEHRMNEFANVLHNPFPNFRQINNSVYEDSFVRSSAISSSLTSFLRAFGLEEVRQHQLSEIGASREHQNQENHSANDSADIPTFLRFSERNILNAMMDNRTSTHPFTMYDTQGNMESVIQLALHLETSWRGINPDDLARLPTHYYCSDSKSSKRDSEKQDKCMVCLEEFSENDHLRTLSCSHQYHVICVDKWLKLNRTCPMCRADAILGPSSYVYLN